MAPSNTSMVGAAAAAALLAVPAVYYCSHARIHRAEADASGVDHTDAKSTGAESPSRKKKLKGMKKGFFSSPPKKKKGKRVGQPSSSSPPPPQQAVVPGGSSGPSANERAAHQLMTGAGPAGAPPSTEEAVSRTVAETWKKAYWDRFQQLLDGEPPVRICNNL